MKRSIHFKRTLTGVITGGALLTASATVPASAQPAIFAESVPLAAVQMDNGAVGTDGVLDQNDEGYLSGDLDGDGINEIGIDEDQSGTLEENEVHGSDLNNDQGLTEDEFTAEVGGEVADGTPTAESAQMDATVPLGVFGNDERFDANDTGFLREDFNGDGTFEIGYDANQSGTLDQNEIYGSDLNNDEALGAPLSADVAAEATPSADADTGDFASIAGGDTIFDVNDDDWMSGDVDGDGTFEIGSDANQNGTLEENEVYGSDRNNDQALTEDEFDAGVGIGDDATGDVTTGDFATYAGDDSTFDVNDEGYLSGDLDGDGVNEIGFDEDQSGTLDENEAYGSDVNNDQALTDDEVDSQT